MTINDEYRTAPPHKPQKTLPHMPCSPRLPSGKAGGEAGRLFRLLPTAAARYKLIFLII
jgi:hypothetical protein